MAEPDWLHHSEGLPAEDRELLATLGTVRSFAAGAAIMHDSDDGDHVVVIRRGFVKIVRIASPEGGDLILGIRGPGDLVGELAGIGGRPRHGSVIALEPVEALVVPGPRFAELVGNRAGMSLAIARILSARLAEADRYRQGPGDLAVARALGQLLLDLTSRFGSRIDDIGWLVGVPLTQQDLADCLGVSYRTVARTLAAWRSAGLIGTRRRRLVIRDIRRFRYHTVIT